MRGRRPSRPECVEHVPGSEQARQRARTVLETMTGSCRVLDACERLKISEPRYHQLRTQLLEAAVASMEPGHAGRPAHKPSPQQEQIAVLNERVADLQVQLRAAQARAEIALVLPNVVRDTLVQDVVMQDAGVQDAVAQDAVAQDAVAQDAVAQDAVAQDAVVSEEHQPEKKTRQPETRRRKQARNRPHRLPGRKKNTCNASSNFAIGNGRV